MKNYLESQLLVRQILPWKKHLLAIGLITVLLAALFSSPLFITPLYRSQARIYPTNVKAFSEESATEQMLEVISSTDLKRRMISRFKLAGRYGIQSGAPNGQTRVLRKYNEMVTCSKTRFETVEVSVLDADPDMACTMVDSLVAFYNAKMLEMRRAKYTEELRGFQNDLARKQNEIDSLNNHMEVYRKNFGLLDYESQTLQLTLGYAQVLARGASRASADDLQKRLDLLADKGGAFLQLQTKMTGLVAQRDEIGRQLEETYSLLHRPETFSMLVEQAFPADTKSYPTRWVIVLASFLAVEFLALLLILFLATPTNPKP